VSLLAIGIILGTFSADVVLSWLWVFIAIAVVSTGYVIGASVTGANRR